MIDDRQVKCLLRRFVLVDDEMQQQFHTVYLPKDVLLAALRKWDCGDVKVDGVYWQIEKILDRNE